MPTDTQSKSGRVVRHVYATYTAPVEGLDGNKRLVTRTAARGSTIADLPEAEEARLDALGALAPKGQSAVDVEAEVKATLERALNPLDNRGEGQGLDTTPVSVSPPGGGAAPAGELLTGDTGAPDVQPPGSVPVPGSPDVSAAFDARGKSAGEVAAWIEADKPDAGTTVAAAQGDPDLAGTVLAAEEQSHGGDPRKTVEEPLQKIIRGE